MNNQKLHIALKRLLMPLFILIVLILITDEVVAQENPPRPFSVSVTAGESLRFGTIIPYGSGSVTIYENGNRDYTPNVICINRLNFGHAGFTINAEPGTHIKIGNGTPVTATLTGSNGDFLTVEIIEPIENQIVTQEQYTHVYFGGTVYVNTVSYNREGLYSGTFTITFTQIQQ